ncbi:hypothetical protein AB0H17_15755 [Streptomyces olivoreticuli]
MKPVDHVTVAPEHLQVDDGREIIESADGHARFMLPTVPSEDADPKTIKGCAKRRMEVVSAIERRDSGAPKWRSTLKKSHPKVRLTNETDGPGYEPKGIESLGAWVVDGP